MSQDVRRSMVSLLMPSCTSLTSHHPMMRDSSTDFQWLSSGDYGVQPHAPSSILSSLYDHHSDDHSLYDDMLVSKDFEDEELAEIDMESFCREDMHNLLLHKAGRRDSSSCALVTSSIYRPQTLFSPVPDHLHQVHLSQDSLDMSGYPCGEVDIIQTCRANKSNYTIAFEGSIICSEASFYTGTDGGLDSALDQRKRDLLEDLERRKAALKMSTSADYNLTTWSKLKKTHNSSNLQRFLLAQQQPPMKRMQCWDLDQKRTMGSSGNVSIMNNHNHHQYDNSFQPGWLFNTTLRRTKSMSSVMGGCHESPTLPDVFVDTPTPTHHNLAVLRAKLNVSQVIMDNMDHESASASPTMYDQNKLRSLLPNCAIPIHHSQHQSMSQLLSKHSQQQQQLKSDVDSASSTTTTTSNNNAAPTNNGQQPSNTNAGGCDRDRQPSFNLVKLFIKQKSSSTDTCMDVSSGLWPSDSPSMSFEQQQQQPNTQPTTINVNIQNRNYFKRRLDGAGLDMTEEENDVDSLDPLLNNNNNCGQKTEGGGGRGAPPPVQRENHTVMESNNNLINNLINNNHCMGTETATVDPQQNSITQIYNNIRNNNGGGAGGNGDQMQIPKNTKNLRRMQQMQETVTRSMQTSIPKLITSATQYASKAADARCSSGSQATEASVMALSQRVKIVPTSFLKQLHRNERRGEGGVAPVYVIYPNYTLPNLDFVTKHDVILSPIDYKETFMGMAAVKLGAISKVRAKEAAASVGTMSTPAMATVYTPPTSAGGRPKSFCDILSGKQRTKFDYKNIYDWKSLIVLLPIEYSRILRSIPDIEKELEGLYDEADDGFGEDHHDQEPQHSEMMSNSQSQRQMYCQTTPVMRRRVPRPMSCDCTAYIMQTSSSSSSSNQPASSGYRGSSTLLTDSEFGVVGIENEMSDDTTAAGLPPTHCGRTPKGILRRNFNRTRMKVQQQQGKRNSMFDGTGEKVVDKRRSLQEFPTQQYFDNIQMAEAAAAAVATAAEPPPTLSPLLNYKQQGSGNDLSGLHRFRNKLSSELEALEWELEAAEEQQQQQLSQNACYDRVKLRNDVSRALSNHPKRVSFSEGSNSDGDSTATVVGYANQVVPQQQQQAKECLLPLPGGVVVNDFSTPPNSPNVSLMVAQQRRQKATQQQQQSEQERIQNNRFKRLQIQWELLSKDSESLLEEMNEIIPVKMETKSGGSTPTGPQRISRIPRPISYPSSRTPETTTTGQSKLGRTLSGGKTTGNTAKKVSSPTTGGGAFTPRVQQQSKGGQPLTKKANVTTNKFVPKTVR